MADVVDDVEPRGLYLQHSRLFGTRNAAHYNTIDCDESAAKAHS